MKRKWIVVVGMLLVTLSLSALQGGCGSAGNNTGGQQTRPDAVQQESKDQQEDAGKKEGAGKQEDQGSANKAGGPAEALRAFIGVAGDPQQMWELMGPATRASYGAPDKIDYSAYAEGLGAFKYTDYRVVREEIAGNEATVEIVGDVTQEGQFFKDKHYTARMVLEDGKWKWEMK